MSHQSKLSVRVWDLVALDLACQTLGLAMSQATKWRGYGGKMQHSATRVISIPGDGRAYEIGVVLVHGQDGKPDYYELQTDLWEYEGKSLVEKIGGKGKKLIQYYSAMAAFCYHKSQGEPAQIIQTPEGHIQCVAEVEV